MNRWYFSLVALCLVTPLAHAHFIWIVPDKDAAAFQVIFSDTLEPDDAKLLEKISGAETFIRTLDGKTAPLKWTEGKNAYRLTPDKEKWNAVGLVCPYGVVQRGKSEPFLLNYYAMYGKPPAGGLYRAETSWERVPLQIHFGEKGLQVLWQGKPLPQAEVVVLAPGADKPEELKTDQDGKIASPFTKVGFYGIRARHVEAKAGKHKDKEYKEVRHYSTRVVWSDPQAKALKTPADPEASKLLADARAARAHWTDFPGFAANIEVNVDGKVSKGTVHVGSEGKVRIEGLDKDVQAWARGTLASIVFHRLDDSASKNTPCAFVDEVKDHPQGRAIRVLTDELHSSYRIKDKQITEVNRVMKGSKFTISMLESQANAEGKFLSVAFMISYWDLDTGELTRSEANHQTWQRVGKYDLPVVTRVLTAAGGKKAGGGGKDAVQAQTLTLTGHKLLTTGK